LFPGQETQAETKTPAKKPGGDVPNIPASLDSEMFRTTWAEWIEFRRQRRLPVTPLVFRKQFTFLEKLGHDAAIDAIEQSIRNGWQGLFPDRRPVTANPGQPNGATARRRDERARHCPGDWEKAQEIG
jgi:hypothetical protein